jgi:hypothetical protein
MKKCYTQSRSGGISYVIKRREASWIGHFQRRNCLLKHVIEEKIERKM